MPGDVYVTTHGGVRIRTHKNEIGEIVVYRPGTGTPIGYMRRNPKGKVWLYPVAGKHMPNASSFANGARMIHKEDADS